MAREISDILGDILAWCSRKGIQNWLSGCSILVTIGLGVIAVCGSCQGPDKFDEIVKGRMYLLFAALVPALQFLSFILGMTLKERLDRVVEETQSLKNRLAKVELIEQNMESIFGVWLNLILSEVQIPGDRRASFYVWDDKGSVGNEFVYLARESNDPKLKRKGRERFPGDQGVISEAWHNNDGVAAYFASNTVKTDADVVKDMIDKYGFSYKSANNLTMKSKVIIGHVIVGQYGKLGVVVIESLQGITNRKERQSYQTKCSEAVKKVTPHITRLFEIYSNSMFKQEDPI